jgi:hypothetical protein
MMAQAARDLGAIVGRWKSDESMRKGSETGGERQRNVTDVRASLAEHQNISRGAG